MKRILLFLALALGVKVNAQVVGGYLPLNSSKSATMGGLKVAGNETVTGTFSVGSTATVSGNALFSSSVGIGSGVTSSLAPLRVVNNSATVDIGASSSGVPAIWFNKSPTSSNYSMFSDGNNLYLNANSSANILMSVNNAVNISQFNNTNSYLLRPATIGATTAPTATLDVVGNAKVSSTFSLGSANLTGGNTGTVAVLSDAKFTLYNAFAPSNLAASTTYHFGAIALSSAPNTSQNTRYNVIPQNCTLSGFSINYYNVTQGSTGTSTIDIIVNNTTVTTLTTVSQPANFGAGLIDTYYSSSLTTTLSAGDKYELRLTTPAFSVAPTSCQMNVVLYLTPR